MPSPQRITQRFRRTDQHRLGQWLPLGSSWKTAASSGLVAHDIYHHLASDTGTFAQEVATLGAEWYIERQPLGDKPLAVTEKLIKALKSICQDLVLNALDSKEKTPFFLRSDAVLHELNFQEIEFFDQVAKECCAFILTMPGVVLASDFETGFFNEVAYGYMQAKDRFPNQSRVREVFLNLASDLENLETCDVPYGHEILIDLDGYDCHISYSDADAPFLAENSVTTAFMMPWCWCSHGFPRSHFTLHLTERDYYEFAIDHQEREESRLADDLSEDREILPELESHALRKVYLVDNALKTALGEQRSIRLDLEVVKAADITPRGHFIL